MSLYKYKHINKILFVRKIRKSLYQREINMSSAWEEEEKMKENEEEEMRGTMASVAIAFLADQFFP